MDDGRIDCRGHVDHYQDVFLATHFKSFRPVGRNKAFRAQARISVSGTLLYPLTPTLSQRESKFDESFINFGLYIYASLFGYAEIPVPRMCESTASHSRK